MADRDLIDDYRSALRRRLPTWSNVDDLLDEVEDHLRSTVDHLVRTGHCRVAAQHLTLERFGEPAVVARSFALTSTGGLRMPTRFTRTTGYVAIAAAIAWLAAGAFAIIGQTSLVTEFSESKYFFWAGLILVAATATAISIVGLLRRAGATGDWRAWVAIASMIACVVALSLFAWFWPVGGGLSAIGCLIAVQRARAAGLPMGGSGWLLVVAFPLGTALFFGLSALQTGPVDEYGDYPISFVSGLFLAAVLLAVALARMGRWLAREVPADGPDRIATA